MTKVREIIQINSGYTSYVDLYEDYYDLVKNRGRMERYKPIAAHRSVFERIANALNPMDRRFYFLSGSYGTGKSHLLLMLANYFSQSGDLPEIEAFFRNYETAQNEVLLKPGEMLKERKAASLKAARSSGRYLIALCRYNLNLDFEGALLRAMEDALKREESPVLLDSHYREALRRIQDWEARRTETRFYTDLEAVLAKLYPDWTLNDLVGGLEEYSEDFLTAFKRCYQVITDAEFSYRKDNLHDIISDFLANSEFKANFKGIVFIYDEFGSAIDSGLVKYQTLLDFAQYCANSTLEKGGTVIFMGAGHKSFRKHGKVGDLNSETLEARVTEIGLQTQGMEDIIGAVVQPRRDSPGWLQQVQPNSAKFTFFSGECTRLRLFNWLPAPKIKNNIIQNIYPMHPLATYALLKLASEAGSDNRSVLKFFAPEFDTGENGWTNVQPYSYPWFIENHEILEQNKLTLYTPDHLVEYFKDSLKATNTRLADSVKTAVVNYDATLRELNSYMARKSQGQLFEEADELMLRIIKVMLIHEIITSQEAPIVNNFPNIQFALDAVSPEEKTQVENRLRMLSEANVLYNNNGIYELTRSDRKDINRMVESYKANPDNRPSNLLESFQEQVPLRASEQYLEAKEYNDTFSEDKRLKILFATPGTLAGTRLVNGKSVSYFTALEEERKKFSGPNGYEGLAVYVFCENDNDIDDAKKTVIHNDQQRVLVAIPKQAINTFDAIFTLKALASDWFTLQAKDFSALEKVEEKTIRDGAMKALNEARQAYFSNAKMLWFGAHGSEIPVSLEKPRDSANKLMQVLYGSKRNTIPHTEFNKVHLNLIGQVRAVFKEAGDILCDLSKPLRVNWTWADNRGGTKYLRKCFVDHQALRIISLDGDVRVLEPEKDLSKFRTALPVYTRLLEDLAGLEGKHDVNFGQFLRVYFEEYGAGELALTLMILLARRYYGDSLRFKREPNTLTDLQITNPDEMLDLVQGKSVQAVIIFEPVSAEDQAYFARVTQIFSDQAAQAGKIYTINDAYVALTQWWDSLPSIARSLVFYEQADKPLAEAFSQAKIKEPFHFIKTALLELLGQTPGQVLVAAKLHSIETRLMAFKATAGAIESGVEERILKGVAQVFGASSNLDVEIQEALKNWYNSLSITQKEHQGYTFHNNDSKPLVKFTAYANIRELLFSTYPEAYGFGKVADWVSDFVTNYIDRLQKGKQHIETRAPNIPKLNLDFENDLTHAGDQVTYKTELVLHAETEGGQGIIYYTEDNSDPANVSSKTRKRLEPGESLTIKGNRKIKLVVADGSGNYGAVQTVNAIDELEKYTIRRPSQMSTGDETITFVLPRNKDAAQNTLASLLKVLVDSNVYTRDELQQAVQDTLKTLK